MKLKEPEIFSVNAKVTVQTNAPIEQAKSPNYETIITEAHSIKRYAWNLQAMKP